MDYKKIDQISASFCAAKWLQVTIYLQNGVNHSCHHPVTHQIPLEKLNSDLGAFHNTDYKIEKRQQMLKGERPSECSYCWNIEDNSDKHLSDRYIKSNDPWAVEFLDKIARPENIKDINPTYLEVSLGNECNLACSYCKPDSSSRIYNELKNHGDYPTFDPYGKIETLKIEKKLPLYEAENNPYISKFEMWLRQIIGDLKVFRLTGGEPFISPLLPKILDILNESGNSELDFSINSNLSVKKSLVEKYIKQISCLKNNKKIKDITLFTSLESFGEQAEYIRFGLNFEQFKENVEYVLKETNFKLVFMVTFNILSLPKYKEFLTYILELKKTYEHDHERGQRVVVDTSYLRSPEFMSVKYVDRDLMYLIEESYTFMKNNLIENLKTHGFSQYELSKYTRIVIWLRALVESGKYDTDDAKTRADFVNFFDEYDKRKNLNFLKTFPELKKFYFRSKMLQKDNLFYQKAQKLRD